MKGGFFENLPKFHDADGPKLLSGDSSAEYNNNLDAFSLWESTEFVQYEYLRFCILLCDMCCSNCYLYEFLVNKITGDSILISSGREKDFLLYTGHA